MSKYSLIDSSVAGESDTDTCSDLEAAGLQPRDSDHHSGHHHDPHHYSDYYEHLATSEHIRPITITEDVNFETMSTVQKICWWMSTAIRLLR